MKLQPTPRPLQQVSPDAPLYFEEIGRRLNVGAVSDLNQTIAGPSIAEVQAISDKVDEILAALRLAGTMSE